MVGDGEVDNQLHGIIKNAHSYSMLVVRGGLYPSSDQQLHNKMHVF